MNEDDRARIARWHNARGWYYLNCTLPWDDYERPGPSFMRNMGWRTAA